MPDRDRLLLVPGSPEVAQGLADLLDRLGDSEWKARAEAAVARVRSLLRFEYVSALDLRAVLAEHATPSDPPAVIDAAHIEHQRAWSRRTFGPRGPLGPLAHIRKELDEIAANPTDLTEWVDVLILAFDGAWRAGHEPQAVIDAIKAKQATNEARTWPDWRGVPDDQPIEHVRATPSDPPQDRAWCESRNPEPPHQRCERGVSCDGRHRDFPSDPSKPETCWIDPAPASADTLVLRVPTDRQLPFDDLNVGVNHVEVEVVIDPRLDKRGEHQSAYGRDTIRLREWNEQVLLHELLHVALSRSAWWHDPQRQVSDPTGHDIIARVEVALWETGWRFRHASADTEGVRLTEEEKSYGRSDPGLQWRGRWYSETSVERILAARLCAATEGKGEA